MSVDCEIKQLLKNYKLYKLQASIDFLDNKIKDKINWLEKVINALDEESHMIIDAIYIKKIPKRYIASCCACNRVTVYRRSEKIIAEIEKLYQKFKEESKN